MPVVIEIEVAGLDQVIQHFAEFPAIFEENLDRGMKDAMALVQDTEGVGVYPPETEANQPPPPYYVRGEGSVLKSGKMVYDSEKLGASFYATGEFDAGAKLWEGRLGNRASYGQFVIGFAQASHMAPKGWRRMIDVAKERLPEIKQILDFWVARALGLAFGKGGNT